MRSLVDVCADVHMKVNINDWLNKKMPWLRRETESVWFAEP